MITPIISESTCETVDILSKYLQNFNNSQLWLFEWTYFSALHVVSIKILDLFDAWNAQTMRPIKKKKLIKKISGIGLMIGGGGISPHQSMKF